MQVGTSEPSKANEAVDDGQLMIAVARRETSALGELIDRYGGRVLAICEAILVDKSDAESVMSDVFLELWNRHQCFDHHRGSLATYLLTLARCRAIDRRRSRISREVKVSQYVAQASKMPERLVDVDTAESAIVRDEQSELVHTALKQLPVDQQRALKMVFFMGCTHQEAASELALPLGTVKSHIRRGLICLKRELASLHGIGDVT